MKTIIHARVEHQTLSIIRQLKSTRGWNDSEIVRAGIKALADKELSAQARAGLRIAGLGEFESGIADLGSNPSHLSDFGR